MTARRLRLVLDTNILLSALFWTSSVPALAFRKAFLYGILLGSSALEAEYLDVFSRPKFDAYASLAARMNFLQKFMRRSTIVVISHKIEECRHPTDNKLLELALSGNADVLVTGDKDLLALHPWRGIAILTPRQYLEL